MPRNTLVINCDIRETRVALIENGVIAELQIERAGARGTVGNIVLGKVTRVLPGMQAAFIDVGLDRAAFLHVEDLIRPDDFEAYLAGARRHESEERFEKGDGGRRHGQPSRPEAAADEDDDDDDEILAPRSDDDDDDDDDEPDSEDRPAADVDDDADDDSDPDADDSDPDAPGREDGMWDRNEPDFLLYTLTVPMAFAPGDTAIYCSANPNLALGMLARATGEDPLYTFDRLLAIPLKIERYGWGTDPAGNPYGGGGVQFLPRDFLKFGQLMLDDGVWEGRRILGHEFVERASSPLYRLGKRGYGYLWWAVELPYGDGTVEGFAALGTGGQVMTVVPSLDLVVAHFGGNYSSPGWQFALDDLIPGQILPAVR